MSYEEIQKIYLKYFFTRYPVINKKKELIGVFNIEKFYWSLIKDEKIIWKDHIDKSLVFISPQERLDKVFEKIQSAYCHLAIVQSRKKNLGIITLQNILNALLGKMKDEKDQLIPNRLN
jgi:CBS domain containing-hemolysin-like protein